MADYQKETETGKTMECTCYCDPAFGNTGVSEFCALHKAAPKMLAALEHAAMSEHHPACDHVHPKRCTCHVGKARAAVAEAKGETS